MFLGTFKNRLLAALIALIGATLLSAPVWSQTATNPIPPSRYLLDQNGVNLATGVVFFENTFLSIGPSGLGGLTYSPRLGQYSSPTPYQLSLYITGASAYATIGTASRVFSVSGTIYTSTDGTGSTLVRSGSGPYLYTLTLSDGTKVIYDSSIVINGSSFATSIIYATGENVSMAWVSKTYCSNNSDGCSTGTYSTIFRLQSVSNSSGYQLHYNYNRPGIFNQAGAALWLQLDSITAINTAVDYCDPTAHACGTFTQTWPTVSFSGTSITDPLGRVTRYTSTSTTFSVKRPSSSVDNTVVTYSSAGAVTSVVTDGRTWTYTYSVSGTNATMVVTDPLGHQRTIVSNTNVGLPTSVTDELGHTTTYTYATSGLLTRVTQPEGNYVDYTYDSRGNVTQTSAVAKPGSGLANIVTTAGYDASCINPVTCNQPNWTQDARGNQTDYTYDATTGLVTSITSPSPTSGAVRPQTRYAYSSLQAYYKNAGGSIVASGVPTYRLTGLSACQTTASCAGAADEVKATITYGNTGVANNLLPTVVLTGSGDGSLTAIKSVTYDAIGNALTVTDPLSQATRLRYDADREVTGVVGPDPDGGGPLKNRAQRISYNSDGQVTLAEQGTAASQSDADWPGFAPLLQIATNYDSSGRKIQMTESAAGTTYAAIQYAYDTLGRVSCVAQRMNPSAFGSLPGACSPGTTGSYGPDRITTTDYTATGRIASVDTAYGTAQHRLETLYNYTDNGQVKNVADGKYNYTNYDYDGFDRLLKTTYPSPTSPGSGNLSDYEQLGYDAAGNVTSLRKRSGDVIGYSYDALNRLTMKDIPGGTASDVYYGYDNLGRQLWARFASTTGGGTTNTFDALGRLTSAIPNFGTQPQIRGILYQYDLAGRRTQMKWWDGNHVDYDYDAADEMTAIRLNNATSGTGVLATFAYDDLGRRTALNRGNGTSTTYAYDPASRLTQLTQDLAGTVRDLTVTLGNYNPAGQIGSRSRSNDAYAWTQAYNVSRNYTANGLNQLTASGAVSLSYDTRGNLTGDGTLTFSYDLENRMTGIVAGSQGTFAYDPLGRLVGTCCGWYGDITWGYDGDHLTIKTANANGGVIERYVFGPNGDEPLVVFDSGGVDTPTWLHADERGSIIAKSNASGTTLATNAYDDYGIPQNPMGGGTTIGPFGYTGQMWVPEAGVYNYKARFYSPTLGRFMQTDPIGYDAGMNLYQYVRADPVNYVDPSGLRLLVTCQIGTAGGGQDPGGPYGSGSFSICTTINVNDSPPLAGRGGGGGGRKVASPPASATQPQQNIPVTSCPSTTSTAARVANLADKISLGAGSVAVTAGVAGLVAAPTGAGLIGLESVAFVAGAVSTGASIVGVIAHAANGDVPGALMDAGGLVGGAVAGRVATRSMASTRMFGDLSASQGRTVKLVTNATGTSAGAASSLLYSCK